MNKPNTIAVALLGTATLLAVATGSATAQERDETRGNNPLSVRSINENDIMMKKTLWRRIDLRETQNASMFSKNNEISKYLMDAVKAGLLDAYDNDSVKTKLTAEKFQQRLIQPNTGDGGLSKEEIEAGFGADGKPAATAGNDGWGAPVKPGAKPAAKPADDGWGTPAKKPAAAATAVAEPVSNDGWGPTPKKKSIAKGKSKGKKTQPIVEMKKDTVAVAKPAVISGDEYFPKELSILEVKEDWIFDRKRSRLYYDIQTVTLILPADKNPAGLEIPVASFKYKDLDKLFRSDPKKFIWYNPQNQAQHKNLADAFDLRLFYGRIIKVSNPGDRDLMGLYGDKEGLLKSYQTEYELMETEHGLWEY
jgi:hypothetical protein